ncbi:sulfite exporter TauE/SafE family protein [Thermococcus argininiproducens]|uniref:Probable membrane transporter protein n=1 Tax=Thermococcus argininiproducens TaxID=2866384 RepID=A0A9E7MBG9_9EURY|nr:sulfite exporter TauE/SafE family protein [Thermococcus argininiproducens]USH00574.1 sulfite exporter TauE/SafE family protein [Thermococcus argininiproducens]
MISYLLDFILGTAIGTIAGLFGIGGGFLIVPSLIFMGLPVHTAIGTSLSCIVVSSFASAYTHVRRGKVLLKVVAIKEVFSIPAALIGAYITIYLEESLLQTVFSLLLFYLAYKMATAPSRENSEKAMDIKYQNIPIVGILSGFISGLLGISGGILNVPLFHVLVEIPVRYSIGTSSVAIFFTALAGTYGHFKVGHVNIETTLLLAPGLIVGGYLGAKGAHILHPEKLKRWFALMLILIGVKMLL